MNRKTVCVLVSASALLAGAAVAQQGPAQLRRRPDQGHRPWPSHLDAGGAGRQHHRRGRRRCGDHGRHRVRAPARQDQGGGGRGRAGQADPLCGQHPPPRRPHRRQPGLLARRGDDRRHPEPEEEPRRRHDQRPDRGQDPPAPQGALPGRTYAGRTSLSVKGRTVQLTAMPTAHTRGDTAVWIPDANVVATGDIVSWGGRYPNIDVGDGGDIDGIVKAVDVFLARSNGRTKIVPGHGALMSRADLVAYRKLLVDARAAVAKAKAAGQTEDRVVEAKPLAGDIQTRAGANDQASANFVRLIYRSVG